ncbi:MAG: MucB/RseB C-terminal domain-containing protein [Steroidobacteraceae bacterium]
MRPRSVHIARTAWQPGTANRWFACLLLLLPLASGRLAAGTDEDPRAWVARMNDALVKRNYDGVFVHRLGGKRETLRIIHRVRDGQMTERVISTDGSGREFVRKGSEWVAYFPDRQIVVVERRTGSGFIAGLHGLDAEAEGHYDIGSMEQARVQGRAVQVITVMPRDPFRYGYRFWIDRKTAMPIKTRLVSASGEVIEEIAFVSLSLPAQIDDELLMPDVDAKGFRWLRRDQPKAEGAVTVRFAPREELLPPGFRVSAWHAARAAAASDNSRIVFTDGLAWVSVFIEPAVVPPRPRRTGEPHPADGPAQMGASAAFTARVDGYRVTAVGEVPPATVKAIAESLQPRR